MIQIESRHKDTAQDSRPRGFTLIELLVVIAIIAILAAILFPVFARARENARRSSCQSNAKQILLGIMQYTQDYDEKYMGMYTYDAARTPQVHYWPTLIEPYVKSPQIFNCPSESLQNYVPTADGYLIDYGLSTQLFEYDGGNQGNSLAVFQQPAATVLLADSINSPRVNPQGYSWQPAYDMNAYYPQYRHLETTTVGFADGHVKSMRKSALEVVVTSENGTTFAANDDNRFVLWNKH